MTFTKSSTLTTIVASGLAVALLTTAISGNAIAANHGEQRIYQSAQFGQIASQLRQDLRREGYYVMDIQADGNNQLDVYAKKDNRPYVLKYTYPELKMISSDKKEWSSVWKNSDNIEDRIKNEARYPTIKQRAIRKISDMGYKVDNIELEEENNRGVFEIDAKRDGQDYEVVLGYPKLNIIKLEKD